MQTQIITHHLLGTTRNLVLGAGLCYSLKKEEYSHIPVIVLFPSIYAGFQLYSQKDAVRAWIRGLRQSDEPPRGFFT
jgi:hypothetical protein